jgi:hypothetical protein
MSRYDDDDDSFERPSGGGSPRGTTNGVGPSSIAYESRRRPGRRRLITSLVVLVALGGFVGIVWHAYNQGKAGGGDAVVPLLKAEDGPTKVRPDQPGGMDVPNQDKLIYDRLAPGGQIAAPPIERLLPPAEAPVARPPAPAPTPAAPAPAMAAPTDLQPPPLGERQVTTVPAPQSAPSQPPIPVAPPAPSQAVPPAQAPAAQAPRPAAAPTQQAAVAPAAPIPSGAARIQLGAVRSADAAQKEWARLQTANRDILGGLTMNVVTADLGERGIYYRIQAGPAADAADLCAKLKARNVGCIVVR